ncbi:MAG: L-serine ammonia-lyase, iron-sulfur-dependent subunit beta [Flexibacteraceae bacterium]
MAERSSVFDMIGPVMIGPSSSHTAGVVRIGLVAHLLLNSAPEKCTVTFYNSFATTFEGHGSDRAILAGLMGMPTDDNRIKTALDVAKERGIAYQFKPVGNASTMHPNTIKIQATSGERTIEVTGQSLGGGVISIVNVNGFTCNFSAGTDTLIIEADDVKGSIAFIADVLSADDCNIATMSCNRRGKADVACLVIEIDSPPRDITIQYLQHLTWVRSVNHLKSVR